MKRLLIIAAFFGASRLTAQVIPPTVDHCATMEQDAINRAKFPQRGTLEDFENTLQRKIKEISLRSSGRTAAVILTFPVVVHVVHHGEAIGTGTNISKEQVMAQIEVLNEDFRRKAGTPGFNNSPVGADIEIEFCLSPVDESGNQMSEPGIHRYNGGKLTWTRGQIDGSLKPQTIWNPNFFYNIWTLDFGGEDSNLLGYAQFPDLSKLPGLNDEQGPDNTDGVVVQYTSFGSVTKGTFPAMQAPYNRGRTLAHETGHWLGLRHIWGDGVCGSDFVDDTPQARAENRGCPANKIGCDAVTAEMVQNYMDYTDDACMNIFTLGQKARIAAVMELSPRRKVVTQNNLCGSVVVAAPVANFTADKQVVLKGGTVIFNDLSTNFPSEWQWEFEGGDPNTSNVQNPQIKYASPGSYKVTLTSSNAVGDSDPFIVEAFISVSVEGLCGTLTNFKTDYTPTIVKLADFGNYKGYLTGHNSAKSKAVSEFFTNPAGYKYISGIKIKFGKAISTKEDAEISVTVWNARGVQNGPGSIIEKKSVLLKQIKADIAADRVTTITLDRETPIFSRAFHVGIELKYEGDSLAIVSSANGEATSSTSWIQSSTGTWDPYSIAYGANIAMNISPVVGMNTSVQVATSKLFINPGDEVIMNARGASIFVWNSTDNQIQNVAGPQIIVRPAQTTSYETTGSGLELCINKATTTIYVKEGSPTAVEGTFDNQVRIYPNPGQNRVEVSFENEYIGEVGIQVYSTVGRATANSVHQKGRQEFNTELNTSSWASGLYLIRVSFGSHTETIKWVKQ